MAYRKEQRRFSCLFSEKAILLRHYERIPLHIAVSLHPGGLLLRLREQALSANAHRGGQPGECLPGQCHRPAGRVETPYVARARSHPDVLPPALHQGERQGIHPPHVGQPDTARATLLYREGRQTPPAGSLLLCRAGVSRLGRRLAGIGLLPKSHCGISFKRAIPPEKQNLQPDGNTLRLPREWNCSTTSCNSK